MPPKISKVEKENKIEYSDRCEDDFYEYRHVVVPQSMLKASKQTHSAPWDEKQWRDFGIVQSRGWVDFMVF